MTFDPALNHGSYSTYNNHKCRCDPCREAAAAYSRTRYRTVRSSRDQRRAHRLAKYGLTEGEYQRLVDAQKGLCAICGTEPDLLHVDHCHQTGAVRGLLCFACNSSLGGFKDDPAVLKKAVGYLEGDRRCRSGLHPWDAETTTNGQCRECRKAYARTWAKEKRRRERQQD